MACASKDTTPRPPGGLKTVLILGAECTGKSTLAAALARRFHTVFVPEAARSFVEESSREVSYGDVLPIAERQIEWEDSLALQANRVLFCDTGPLVTKVLSEYYFGACPPEVAALADRRTYDLLVLTPPEIPWVDDPKQRSTPTDQKAIHELLLAELNARDVARLTVLGPLDERIRIVEDALGSLPPA